MESELRVPGSRPPAVIVIGGSAGALDALSLLLPALPETLPSAVVVVIHVPPERDNAIVQVLSTASRLPVCEAEDKMQVTTGAIYVAPADYHLLLESDGSLALSADEAVLFSRPSIDVLFQSAAHAFGERALGILLSGASADGAEGLAAIRARGGTTWVQQPESAAVAVMPAAALALAPHRSLDVRDMGQLLAELGVT
jgi:two-component system, chemotaxis family, protein-glutamate methylesterase/glutaminase